MGIYAFSMGNQAYKWILPCVGQLKKDSIYVISCYSQTRAAVAPLTSEPPPYAAPTASTALFHTFASLYTLLSVA
ncbi:hypothetical protein J6590_051968 [Homalodisca vitripennis]|nr:hypothetical protein J6590_051968 [Homalodisca vitripennis]